MLLLGVGVVVVLLLLVVVGSTAAWLLGLFAVRMRKPKNAAAASPSTAITPRTNGIGDRRCALCLPTSIHSSAATAGRTGCVCPIPPGT